ncbi:unnamed protein product [Linum trigynum]|uniref:Uncharacterized protein n=1 Tax=Linum trigynum TaxID=586398 RepID=A0AAV2CKD5_9ROSI
MGPLTTKNACSETSKEGRKMSKLDLDGASNEVTTTRPYIKSSMSTSMEQDNVRRLPLHPLKEEGSRRLHGLHLGLNHKSVYDDNNDKLGCTTTF